MKPTCREVQMAVALAFDMEVFELTGPCRQRALSLPRSIYAQVAYQYTGKSWPVIGRIGGRDHTTMLHHRARCRERLASGDLEARTQYLMTLAILKQIVRQRRIHGVAA